jgi:hypothetical protein
MRAVDHNLGRNDPCHCGSRKKYKQCCLAKDEAAEREARAKTQGEVSSVAEPAHVPAGPEPRHKTRQPWKRTQANTRGFARVTATRKVGG